MVLSVFAGLVYLFLLLLAAVGVYDFFATGAVRRDLLVLICGFVVVGYTLGGIAESLARIAEALEKRNE